MVKPISNFSADETPELIAFFTRPESLCGLHQLAAFVTNDPEVVALPWGAGWDPSARKFYKTDELSFTVPYQMFNDMLSRFDESFLKTDSWATVQKRSSAAKKPGEKFRRSFESNGEYCNYSQAGHLNDIMYLLIREAELYISFGNPKIL